MKANTFQLLAFSCGIFLSSVCQAFNRDDFDIFRELIVSEIQREESGLTIDNDLVNIFDEYVFGDQPLIAGLIRLAFHDCAGFEL